MYSLQRIVGTFIFHIPTAFTFYRVSVEGVNHVDPILQPSHRMAQLDLSLFSGIIFSSCFPDQFMEMIESFLRSIGIEAEIMDIPKMMIRDMDDHFFYEFNGRFDHIMSFIVCMIMIIPVDLILFPVV